MDRTARAEARTHPKKDFRYVLAWLYLKLVGWHAAGKRPPLSKFVVIGYVDYRKKAGGIGPVIHPSGDIEADMAIIRDFFRPSHPGIRTDSDLP